MTLLTVNLCKNRLQVFHAMLSSNSKSKPGIDGSGSHEKHHQLSGDSEDDSLLGKFHNFLGVFMTPISIFVSSETATGVIYEIRNHGIMELRNSELRNYGTAS